MYLQSTDSNCDRKNHSDKILDNLFKREDAGSGVSDKSSANEEQQFISNKIKSTQNNCQLLILKTSLKHHLNVKRKVKKIFARLLKHLFHKDILS